MRISERISWAAIFSLPLVALFDLLTRWYADRMVARGEGWEMAFYFSPLAFRAKDGLLLLAVALGIVGTFAGPRWYHRALSLMSGVICIGWLIVLHKW